MSEFKTTGRIVAIFPTEYRGERQFASRNFVIEIESQYPQQVQFQTVQAYCDQLDLHTIGQDVEVSFDLRGRAYEKDGATKYFTTLNAWRIKKVGDQSGNANTMTAQSAPQAAPAPIDDSAESLFGPSKDDKNADDDSDLPF
jgi:single-strand DNA-binding protein